MATVWEPPQPPDLGAPPAPAPAAPDPDAPPPVRWWLPFVVGVAIYIGLGMLVAVVALAAGWQEGDLPDRFTLIATLLQDAALIGGAVLTVRLAGARPAWDLGLRRVRPSRGLLLAAGVFVAFFVFLAVWSAVLSVDESDDLAQELGARDSTLNLIGVAFLVVIAAPIAEELFFRGFMYGALRGAIGWVGAALVTGIVFGVIHAGGTDAVFLVPLAVLGILLCLLYRYTGSVLPCMGVHAFNNALALGTSLSWDAPAVVATVVLAPAVVVAIASAFSVARPGPAAAGG